MTARDPHDEKECTLCGLLVSDCACTMREPTFAEREFSRAMRLSRAELETLVRDRAGKQ